MADRPAFIYLHGFASGPQSTKARYFRERFEELRVPLEIPDLNQGEEGFRNLTLSRSVAQVRQIIDESGKESAVLIGSSLGGYTAALTASRDPRVVGLVLLCPAFDLPARWTQWLDREGIDRWRATGELEVDHHAWNRKEKIGFAVYRDALGHSPYPKVAVPTLIHHGRNDTEVPLGTSEKFAWGQDHVRLIAYDSDHALTDVIEPIWTETRAFLAPWIG